jgi:hypothetical protein
MRLLLSMLFVLMLNSPAIAEGTLAESFVAQCEKVLQCGIDKMKSEPNANQDMIQMIETQMAGRCQAQAEKMAQAEQSPYADKMRACFDAMAELGCEDIEAGIKPSACDDVN